MAGPSDKDITLASMRRDRVKDTLPSHFNSDYPQFVEFLEEYYNFMGSEGGWTDLINQLRDVRNPDLVAAQFMDDLRKEYGADFPNLTTMDDATALKIFIFWYRSKGNREGIEAYFRLFLNSDAQVSYPGDQMLRVSDGNWDASANDWTDAKGRISDSTIVIQDSLFYQTHSYLIKSGVSIVDWGDVYKKLAHPAGWEFFGEVELNMFANFEFETRTPTITPGIQPIDVPTLILLMIAAFNSQAHIQQIVKTFDVFAPGWTKTRTLQEVGLNILGSTYTLGALGSLVISDITDGTNLTSLRPPARITITT